MAALKIPEHVSRGLHTCDLEQRKADIFNRRPGDLPGPDCQKCHNKGRVMRVVDGRLVIGECQCMPARKSIALMQKSGLGELLDRCTFDAYKTQSHWQEEAKKIAVAYASNHDGRWFVASGCRGSGKTHLCTAICGELLRSGIGVRYMLWVDESRRLKSAVNDNAEYLRIIEPLKTVKVLYIDDLFKPRTEDDRYTGKRRRVTASGADITLAYEILNNRYMREDLLTIISTELSIEEIMDLDPALGSRIYEKSKGNYICMTGDKDWRMLS